MMWIQKQIHKLINGSRNQEHQWSRGSLKLWTGRLVQHTDRDVSSGDQCVGQGLIPLSVEVRPLAGININIDLGINMDHD